MAESCEDWGTLDRGRDQEKRQAIALYRIHLSAICQGLTGIVENGNFRDEMGMAHRGQAWSSVPHYFILLLALNIKAYYRPKAYYAVKMGRCG